MLWKKVTIILEQTFVYRLLHFPSEKNLILETLVLILVFVGMIDWFHKYTRHTFSVFGGTISAGPKAKSLLPANISEKGTASGKQETALF